LASPVSEPPVLAQPPRLRRVLRSFSYAVEGLGTLLRTQPNFVVHVVAACLAVGLGVILRLDFRDMALVVLTIALVLVVECVNTALETLCDLVSPGFHPLIRRAKDISAAAVLLAALAAVGVAALLYLPRLASMLK
jgi:diacylglycerol kinase (ATP)